MSRLALAVPAVATICAAVLPSLVGGQRAASTHAADARVRRHDALSRAALPHGRPAARRPRHDGDRRPVAAAHLLYGRGERRRVQDHRRRRVVDSDHRRQGSRRVHGLDRRRRIRSEHRSTSAPARTTSAATSRPGAACTSRPTPARRGPSPACTTPGRSAPCAFIRRTRTSLWVAAIGNAFKPNAERGVFKTTDGGKTWRKCCSCPTASARRTSSSIRRTRTSSTRGCGAASESRGRSSAARSEGRLLQEHRRRRALHEGHERPADGA